VLALLRAFLDIALHRRGPEDLPASGLLLGLALAAYVAIQLVYLQLPALQVAHPFALLAAETAFTLASVWALLKVFAVERRFRQAVTAYVGTAALFSTLALPLLQVVTSFDPQSMQFTATAILIWLVVFWAIDVSSFVLSRAIDRPYVVALGIVLGYELLTYSLRITFFPPLNPPPAS
jgi:fucose 4-O-acetylase-like acetyltransferase